MDPSPTFIVYNSFGLLHQATQKHALAHGYAITKKWTKSDKNKNSSKSSLFATEDLTTNNATNSSIQNNNVLPNQATALHRHGTWVRQPTKRAAEALRHCKRARHA